MQMKKQIVFLILLWAAVFLCMGCIFAFSAENAAESTDTSNGLLYSILRLFDPRFDSYSEEEQGALLEGYSFYIRKTAHFSIYAILGFLVSNAFAYQSHVYGKPSLSKRLGFSLLIGVLYAVSDEIHQYFVPGRSCDVRDMLIDSAGVAVGILLSFILTLLIKKHRKN